MATASYDSIRITHNARLREPNISSVVISNYGSNVMYVIARDVRRPVPPVNTLMGAPVPIAPFKIESFGHGFDMDLRIEFDGGSGDAVIDFIKINEC